ncbi:patatin-like phospholipase family protein [Pseudodonghicola flavimaris]|uniref:Patatin-like phospholipase family protein n=1 Tax=Pseudodonghicola flavimaris TaxID=3050036 RepID=A0ABT7F1H5_9RHOB|nr:patatin-like phospholipase family protein [Pseudodonghicola flavimaris]MDK3018452.1 patatin-like phospholipase family protein [Pseudodonghicola flavimaris]
MTETRRINLALQGGGAHGAYTWGVLDRLLEEEDLEIASITGTSAGALNAAAFKAGLIEGGRAGAREKLDWLWGRMHGMGDMRLSHWLGVLEPAQVAQAIEYSLPFSLADAWSRMVSPYAYGPFYMNPLEPLVKSLDFDHVCAAALPELFICATKVHSGKIRVFSGEEISTDAILASACLPNMFQAVEIADPETGELEAYWDGGYTGNPALFPLFRMDLPPDVVVVNINPLERREVPITPQQIQNRINEISFNSSLLRELRAINFVQRLIDEGTVEQDRMKRVFVHMIADDDLMNELSVATKVVPTPMILGHLKEAGRASADAFLSEHKDNLGKRNSVDLEKMFG